MTLRLAPPYHKEPGAGPIGPIETHSTRNAPGTDHGSWPFCWRQSRQGKEIEMINKDQVGGVAKQAKGAVKEAAGKMAGDRETEAEGKLDKAAGKVQKTYGDVKEDVKKSM
jgi:uncharacterized protein YjbJ (UPF0337 family)